MAKKFFRTLVGAAVAAGAAVLVSRYLKEMGKGSAPEDVEEEEDRKAGGEKVKDAAKRAYVAIRESGDIGEAAEEIADAAKEAVDEAGKLAETVSAGTVDFVKKEKARFEEDPEAFRQEIRGNIRSMGEDLKNIGGDLLDAAAAAKEKFTETVSDEERLKEIRDQAAKRYEDALKEKEKN